MKTDELEWRHAVPGNRINSDEIHVWRAFIDVNTVEFENLSRLLSVDELKRAGRFHFEIDQKRFVAARGILRKILAGYLNMDPVAICFEYNAHGKPMLAGDELYFNLSHSGAFALYAVARRKQIGIDIENMSGKVSVEQVAQQFFSKNEISALEQTDITHRPELFFQYWTRKEAFLKARGEGLSFPMEQCDVSLINGKILSPVTLQGNQKEVSNFYVRDLFPGEGYAAAIAIEEGVYNLSCRHFSTSNILS